MTFKALIDNVDKALNNAVPSNIVDGIFVKDRILKEVIEHIIEFDINGVTKVKAYATGVLKLHLLDDESAHIISINGEEGLIGSTVMSIDFYKENEYDIEGTLTFES